MSRFRAQKPAEAKTGDEKPAEPAKPAVDPAKPAEPAKAEEPKPGEKPAEPAKPAESALPPEVPSKLAETIFSNEKLSAALEEAGLKDELGEALRSAAREGEFRKVFVDVDAAKHARAQAGILARADMAASNLKAGDMASTRDFVQKVLMPMSYILKEDGTPETMEIDDGRGGKSTVYRTDGTVGVLLSNLGDLYIDRTIFDANEMLEFVKAHPDDPRADDIKSQAEALLASADMLKEHHGSKGKPVDDSKLPPEVKAEKQRIEAAKRELDEKQAKDRSERFTQFQNDLVTESDKTLDSMIDGWLDKSSLAASQGDSQQSKDSKEFMRTSIRAQIRQALYGKLNADELFLDEQEQLGRRGPSALKELTRTYRRYAENYVYDIATPILTAAGHEWVRQAKARAEKIATQEDASRVDARAGSAAAKPHVPEFDALKAIREFTADFIQKNHREPTLDEKVAFGRQQEKDWKAKHMASV